MFGLATASKQDTILRTQSTILQNQGLLMANTARLLTAVESLKSLVTPLGTELTALRQEHATTQPQVDAAAAAVEGVVQALTELTTNPAV